MTPVELLECSICLDIIQYDRCMMTSCNHMYHANCLTAWYNMGRVNCPLCRRVQSIEYSEPNHLNNNLNNEINNLTNYLNNETNNLTNYQNNYQIDNEIINEINNEMNWYIENLLPINVDDILVVN